MTSNTTDYFDLIPEYHHGLLDSAMNNLFEQELANNSELQGELEEFRRFGQLYGKLDSDEPQASDMHFNAILSSIDTAAQEQRNPSSQKNKPEPSITSSLFELWAWLKDSVSIPWGVALVQTAVIVILLLPGTNQESFKTLSRSSATDDALSGLSFNIVFKKSAQEEEIRKLLLSLGGSITSGPSAQGRYVVFLSSDTTAADAEEILKESAIVIFSKRAY